MNELILQEQRLLSVEEFRQFVRARTKQQAYDILRKNPFLVVRLGERSMRIDRVKLEKWVESGGAKSVA